MRLIQLNINLFIKRIPFIERKRLLAARWPITDEIFLKSIYKLRNTFKKVVFQDYSMKFEAKNYIEYISKKLGMKFHHQTFSFIAKNTKLCNPWVNEKRMLVQSNYSDTKFKWMTVLFELNIFWNKEVKFNNILIVQISLPYFEL